MASTATVEDDHAVAENVLGVALAHNLRQIYQGLGSPVGEVICLKDNICVAGVPQVNRTGMVESWIPESNVTVVSRISEAGGEIIGTATCENTSYSPLSNTSSIGAVQNPYACGYSAGGSSSEAEAMVGSLDNLVDMGIDAD